MHVRVRAELGLLPDPRADDERAAAERAELLGLLAGHGLLLPDPTENDLVVALHELLATASNRLLLTSPQNALGEQRQPNLPGTIDQYPNWRIPLPVPGDELLTHPTVCGRSRRCAGPAPGERATREERMWGRGQVLPTLWVRRMTALERTSRCSPRWPSGLSCACSGRMAPR